MASERLFEMLAEALSQPSKAYRAAETGLGIPKKAIEGYRYGAGVGDEIRKRRNAQMTLRDSLGGNVPERFSKVADLPQEQVRDFAPLTHLGEETGLNDLDKEALRDARQEKALTAREAMHQKGLEAAEKRHAGTLAMMGKRLEAQKQGKEEKKVRANNMELDRSRGLIRTIDSSLAKVGPFTTGVAGAFLKNIPATLAKDLDQTLLTVKANVGFEELQRMRQSSPTGGALGQVSDAENRLLQATRGSLDQAQSREQVVSNLADMRKHYSNVILAIESETGDPEADDAIAKVISSGVSEQKKRARIQGIRSAAGF